MAKKQKNDLKMNSNFPQERRLFSGWWIAVAAAIMVIGTYSLLCQFAYPVNDDWIYASNGRDRGMFTSLNSYWHDTGGRWLSACLLYSLGFFQDLPGSYPLLAFLTLGSIVAAGWPLMRLVKPGSWRITLGMTMVLAATQCVALPLLTGIGNLGPHVAMPETVYWMSGAWTYAIAYPLLAFAVWGLIAGPRWLAWSTAVAAGLLLSGLSETAAILAGVTGCALGLSGCRRGWALMAAAIAGFTFCAFSPGNLHRMEMLRREVQTAGGIEALPTAMLNAVGFTLGRVRDWCFNPAVTVLALILCWWAANLPVETVRIWRWRVLIGLGALFVGVWAAAVPSFALVGFLEGRQEGLISLLAVPAILSISYMIGRGFPSLIQGSFGWTVAFLFLLTSVVVQTGWLLPISPIGNWIGCIAAPIAVVLLLAVFCDWWQRALMMLMALALLWQPAWWQAVADLGGKAPNLHRRQCSRDQEVRTLIREAHQEIVLPYLAQPELQPRTIRIYEVQPGWMADGYGTYFGVKKILFSDRIQTPMPLRRRIVDQDPIQ